MAHIPQTNSLKFDHPIGKLLNSLYSPILRHLPPEIISYIFTLLDVSTTLVTQKQQRSNKNRRVGTQFTIGAVCQAWRVIAWSTPDLWSSIVLHFTKRTLGLNKACISLVSDWLGRSGQLPLSIRIFFDSAANPSLKFRADLISLAKIINQYSARWFHFDLTCPSKVVKLFRAEGSHAPMLESIRLSMPGCLGPDFLAATCPRLRKVHFVTVQVANIQWNSVTHICMQNIHLENCLNVLRSIPLLVHAEVKAIARSDFEPSNRIVIPLKSLQVDGFGRGDLVLFRYITCPALDELIIDWWGFGLEEDFIISFLQGSHQLRSITLLNYKEVSLKLIEILQAAPSLTKLDLRVMEDLNPVPLKEGINIVGVLGMILSSQSDYSQERFLPHLETFDYRGPFSYAPVSSLSTTVTAVKIPLQLAKFNFHSTTYTSLDAISCFSSLIERGVTVHVCDNGEDILQSSIDYYDRKKRLLNRDWADNLDMSLMQDPS